MKNSCLPLKKRASLTEYISRIEDKDNKIALLGYCVDRLMFQLVTTCKAELEAFVERYKVMEEEASSKGREVGEKITELRRRLKSGEIDNRQYQKQLTPLKNEKKEIAAALRRYELSTLSNMFPEMVITVDEVAHYLEEERQCSQRRVGQRGCFMR